MSMRKTNKYRLILRQARKSGYKIRHRMLRDAGGYFDADTKEITISSENRDTVMGCFILLHEIRHFHQCFDKKYHNFMRGYKNYSRKAMLEIIEAEQDASRFAKMVMKKIGLKFNPPELYKKNLPEYLKYWREAYFEN